MADLYDSQWVENYFDAFGEQEWERLAKSPAREIQYLVHKRVLQKYLVPRNAVLEIGAGPGRFTKDIVNLDCRVSVTDISKVQVELNRAKAVELGFDAGVVEWRQLDMCDMSCYPDASFDAVIAYGGPLSYVLNQRDMAMSECIRVLKPGGLILASVMNLWGTIRQYLEGVIEYTLEENRAIISTGDLVTSNAQFATHQCHLFNSQELKAFFESHGLNVLDMAASNVLTPVYDDRLMDIRQDEEKWSQVVEMELQACHMPGCLDSGTHIIVVGRKAT